MSDPAAPLRELERKNDFFVGIDSDGCVFDTMEIKHKECFCPHFIQHWRLQAVAKYAREIWEFVNLYSKWRGVNRFLALLKAFDLVASRAEIRARDVPAPDVPSLRAWVDEESKLGNPALEGKVQETDDPVLRRTLAWSNAVNETIGAMVHGCPPYARIRESLAKLRDRADMIVVSQTPGEALEREWKEHELDGLVRLIAGQEMGTKAQHIQMAAGGRYPADRTLMIGDAPGDLEAARANGALFYPIMPGSEEASWERFHDEAIDKFLGGAYAGAYEEGLVAKFEKCLPESPPWGGVLSAEC